MKVKKLQNTISGVYPVTLVKWYYAKKFISKFLRTGDNKEKIVVPEDTKLCLYCKDSEICKFHKSYNTVVNACSNGVIILDKEIYATRNEIFSYDCEQNKIRIVYCPHFSQIRVPIQKLCRRTVLYVQLIEIKCEKFALDPNAIKTIATEFDINSLLPFRCWFAGDMDIVVKEDDLAIVCNK